MSMIKLFITRDKALLGAAVPYRVFIDGKEMCKLSFGQSVSDDIPEKKTSLKFLMVGSSFVLHNVEKEVTLFPDKCKTNIVDCTITTKVNYWGWFTLGIMEATCRPEIKIVYR